MSTLTNAQISRTYKVSRPTVGNWIKQALAKENLLKLINSDGKYYISDTVHNHNELTRLRDEGRKYRTYSSLKKYEIPEEFYKIFNPEQVLEIANDLEFKNLVNLKHCYKNIGAVYWDKYYREEANILSKSVEEVLNSNLEMINYHLKSHKVNLLDLGCGNGLPLLHLTKYLKNNNKLSGYEIYDSSEDLMEIALININPLLSGIKINKNVVDLEVGGYSNKFLQSRSENTTNLIALFGNTINNFDDRILVLKNIFKGMIPNDLFLITYSIEGGESSSELSYAKDTYSELHEEWLLQLLGFDVTDCEIPLYWDQNKKIKHKTIKLDKDYEIKFKISGSERIIHLHESTEISRWKHSILSLNEIFNELDFCGFKIKGLQLDATKSNVMILCEVKP